MLTERKSYVVVDGWATLPSDFGDDVDCARTVEEAVLLLRRRHGARRRIDQLWLSWELLHEETSQAVVDLIVDTEVKDVIGEVVMVTDNPERMDQMGALLGPHFLEWNQLTDMRRRDSILSDAPVQPPQPPRGTGLPHHARLRSAGVRIDPGLSDDELESVQERHGFVFAAPHRRFLQAGLPVDTHAGQGSWPDWRHGDPGRLEQWIMRTPPAHPRTGQPNQPAAPLIPLWQGRYYPSGPDRTVGPVISAIDGRDILYWAPNLSGWLDRDFDGEPWSLFRLPSGLEVPYWSSIVERDDERLGAELWPDVPVVADLEEDVPPSP